VVSPHSALLGVALGLSALLAARRDQLVVAGLAASACSAALAVTAACWRG
jgi:hypothetical protein